jgi:hypothetical protein
MKMPPSQYRSSVTRFRGGFNLRSHDRFSGRPPGLPVEGDAWIRPKSHFAEWSGRNLDLNYSSFRSSIAPEALSMD